MEFASKFRSYASTVAKATSLKNLFHRPEQVHTEGAASDIMGFIGEIRASYPAENVAALPHDDPLMQYAQEASHPSLSVEPSTFPPEALHPDAAILDLGQDDNGFLLDDEDVLELG